MMAVVAILQKPCKNHALASKKTRLSQGTLFQLDGFGDEEAARIRGGSMRGWHGSLTWPSIFRRCGARLGRGNVKRGRLAIATIPSKTSVLEVYFSHGTDLHQCFIRSLCAVWFAQWNKLSAQWSWFFYLYHTGQEANQLTLHSKLSPSQLLSMHPHKSKTWSVKLMDYGSVQEVRQHWNTGNLLNLLNLLIHDPVWRPQDPTRVSPHSALQHFTTLIAALKKNWFFQG